MNRLRCGIPFVLFLCVGCGLKPAKPGAGPAAADTVTVVAGPALPASDHSKAVSRPGDIELAGVAPGTPAPTLKETDHLPAREKFRSFPSPQWYRFRTGATRVKMLTEGGGNVFSEAATAGGLVWLAKHQAADGHWSFTRFCDPGKCNCGGVGTMDNDVAATALALLPFTGAGQTHKGGAASGNKYTKQISMGSRFLLDKQNKEGEFSPDMYAQALATLVTCELFGLTQDSELRDPAQRGLRYIVAAQSAEGGWRYRRGQRGYDTSVGGWQIQALKAGEWAGLDVPAECFAKCRKWLDHAESEPAHFGYSAEALRDPKPPTTARMSAVGIACRHYLGQFYYHRDKDPYLPAFQRSRDVLFNYYATLGHRDIPGPGWEAWNPIMRDSLIASQNHGEDAEHPHEKGSWYDRDDAVVTSYGGRLFETSLSLLMLEVYYRNPPLLIREEKSDKEVLKGAK